MRKATRFRAAFLRMMSGILEQECFPEGGRERSVRVREHASVESARVEVRDTQLGVPLLHLFGERDGVFDRYGACAPVLAEAGPEPGRGGGPPVELSVDILDEMLRF